MKNIIDEVFPISAKSLKEIESLLKLETYKKGEIFIQKNKRNEKEYFILDGICNSYLINPDGKNITISFFIANSILTPYTSRTREEKSLLNFKALTDVKLASINAIEFEKMMIENIEIRSFGNKVLRNELSQKMEKELALASLSAKERLFKFREQFPVLENMIPHNDIASYLGVTNISLSRLRNDLAG